MNKRSRRAAKKAHKASGHKRTAKKDRRGTHGYRKGSKSKTMKGKKDFTTKKSSKVFNRRKHYQKHAKGSRVIRRPYHKKRGGKLHMSDLHEVYSPAFRPHGTEVHPTNLAITPVGGLDRGWDGRQYSLNNKHTIGTGPTLDGLVNAINKDGGIPGPRITTANLQHIILVSPTPKNDWGKGGLYSSGLFNKQQRQWLTTPGGSKYVKWVATAIKNYFDKYQGAPDARIEGTDIPNTLKYWEKMLSPPSS